MRVAYFDCFSGIAGDMIIGSMIDAGVDIKYLKAELKKLNLSGYKITSEKEERNGIWGTKFDVNLTQKQSERKIKDIFQIIDESGLYKEIKEKSKKVFSKIASAEAKIHNKKINEIHLHEVGAIDSIIDIVGAMILIKEMDIQEIYASKLHTGTGFIDCAHGKLPVPAPATMELLKGIPIYSTGIRSELVTPTGAGIITILSKSFGEMPPMKIESIGYGLGSRKLSIPNALRVLIGDTDIIHDEDRVIELETNIDDMNPELYGYVMELLLKKGAKDVFLTPVYMKKTRPGIILSVISPLDKVDELLTIIFKETTTLGVRISEIKRRKKLKRETKIIDTKFGKIKIKVGIAENGAKNFSPEYEDCGKIAKKYKIPLKEVYEEVKRRSK
ncbi:nickel pincer cofactor biosynthesis protein LarC [candidate division WOR-3 bacterium]|nr:nickel pincer cofactor biosynthesis protein LarC [candidate division WOR-3 bacterium]